MQGDDLGIRGEYCPRSRRRNKTTLDGDTLKEGIRAEGIHRVVSIRYMLFLF